MNLGFNKDEEGELKWLERKDLDDKDRLKLPSELLKEKDSISLQLAKKDSLQTNSRCVSVDTISIAPDGRNKKKERFKGKTALVKFRCTVMEKKLFKNRAKHCGLTLSEYFRRVAFEKKITERLTKEEIVIYRTLVKFHNNFKAIGNMYRKRNPKLTRTVYALADEIKKHLQKLKP